MLWHIDTDIVGLLVLCALYYYTVKLLPDDTFTNRNKCFVRCLRAGIAMTLIDIAASLVMDFPFSRSAYYILMTSYLLMLELMSLLWLMYELSILYEDGAETVRFIKIGAYVLYAVYVLLVLSNPWSELLFSLGENMQYTRGVLFIPVLACLKCIFSAALLILIVARRKSIPPSYPIAVLILQPLIVGSATIVQLLNPGWLLICSAYMLCLLLAFLFFQNIRVRTERTKLGNITQMIDKFTSGMTRSELRDDGSFDIQYMSGGMADICEAAVDVLRERLSRDILSGVHPDDREKVSRNLKRMAEKHGSQEMTYRYFTDAGSLKWINVRANTTEQNGVVTIFATYSDVSELTRVDHILDAALVNTGVSIWEYDFRRRCIIQYQISTEMHGFEQIVPNVPESLVESGFVHPDSAEAFYEMYDKLRQGAPFAEGVFKVQTSDRRGYWFEHIRYTNAFDQNGLPYRAIGMSTDETAQQEAIAKYEREREKERALMADESLLAHASYDLTGGELLYFHRADDSESSSGAQPEFCFGAKNAELLIDEAERSRFLELNDRDRLLALFDEGETEFKQEYRRRMDDETVSWVRNTLRLLRDPSSGRVILFEYWYNIETEKMQELMYHSIATDNFDFVARIDAKTRRFNTLPKEGLSFHMPPQRGEDADIVTHELFDECVLAEDREMAIHNSLVENIREHLAKSARFVFTYRLIRPDGDLRYKKVTQYYIDPQREIIALMREDITELMQEETEQKRVLSEALSAANQASLAKSQFLSRVSHELRTPLNAIIGFMDLAKDSEIEEMKGYLANSAAAARQLLSIINDVLDMSSIESGKMKIAHTPFDIRALIKSISDMYLSQCEHKGLSYSTSLLTPIDEYLIGDALRVNQILLNLLNNALKFTERGSVKLSISQRDTGINRVVLRFEVSDTGCGMSEEMQKRMFRAFEQESSVTAQKYGGNGLGLSIVGNLVSLMNGVINVESKSGVGSTFTVDLPFAKCEMPDSAAILEEAEHIHVLAIDDTKADLDYISAVLTRLGVRHRCAESGDLALAELKRAAECGEAYNVCIVDWKLPDESGLDITRRIRASFGDSPMVIIVSAYDHYQADESVKASGANMFISKPVFQSSLFDLFVGMTGGKLNAGIGRGEISGEISDMRILLAEDNAMNRTMMDNILLRKFGIRCEIAEDGAIALQKFLASPRGGYDAILMDIQMPNMNGYEAAQAIRASAHPDAQSVQIIAVTANAFSEDITKSLSSGMNSHVSKPVDTDELASALERAYAFSRGLNGGLRIAKE